MKGLTQGIRQVEAEPGLGTNVVSLQSRALVWFCCFLFGVKGKEKEEGAEHEAQVSWSADQRNRKARNWDTYEQAWREDETLHPLYP